MMNKNMTKRTLILSLASLLLCFTMLLGTTFAWFTDSVTSAGNKIASGNLKVDLEVLAEDNSAWSSVKDDPAPIFNYDKWEPGFVQVKVLRVVNKGTLALKWKAALTSTSPLNELADVIDVYVKVGVEEYPDERVDLDGWTKVGTLADFIENIETTTVGELAANTSAALGIAFKMQEDAGNTYQDKELGAFDIMILATQLNAEEDSFGPDYDESAEFNDPRS